MRRIASLAGFALVTIVALLPLRASARTAGGDAAQLVRRGAAAFEEGDHAAAETAWRAALRLYAEAGDVDGQIDVHRDRANLRYRVGSYLDALEELRRAERLAEEHDRGSKLALVKDALGVCYTFSRQFREAAAQFDSAERLCRKPDVVTGPTTLAGVLLNRANLLAAWAEAPSASSQDKPDADQCLRAYADAIAAAETLDGDDGDRLIAHATANAAFAAARAGRFESANTYNARALAAARRMQGSRDKVDLLVLAGQTDELLIAHQTGRDERTRLERRAFDAYELAKVVAADLHNPRAGSYAVGYQGHLYELAGRRAEALTLTRQAVRLAEQARAPESLYLWEWQSARVLNGVGRPGEATAAYTRAIETLDVVRDDLAVGFGNYGARGSFRTQVGPLYYDAADLLLRSAAAAESPPERDRYLRATIDVVDRLRVAELRSHLSTTCLSQNRKGEEVNLTSPASLANLGGNPAVICFIPLSDRLEIVAYTPAGIERASAPIGSSELMSEVRQFRKACENVTSSRYRAHAKKLYESLIRPVEGMLRAREVKTLVFVPDGALRSIPMAALIYDDGDGNERYLVEDYAVGVLPGFTFVCGQGAIGGGKSPRLLAAGLGKLASESTETTDGVDRAAPAADLEGVAPELDDVKRALGVKTTTLLNADFTPAGFRAELRRAAQTVPYTVVHLASHAEFSADVGQSSILAHPDERGGGDRIGLNALAEALRQSSFVGAPVELVTLSACNTVTGDDESVLELASLGLGGLLVKAGAASALASQWAVDDDSTGQLMARFYQELRRDPRAGKAKALQRAQLEALADNPHPYFWAAFVLIGDWM